MIYIIAPSVKDILEIQNREEQYYWSAAAEVLFRGEGWLSVCSSYSNSRSAGVVATRGVKPTFLQEVRPSFAFFEGPLATETIQAFGVEVEELPVSRSVSVRWANGTKESLHYIEEWYRCPASGKPIRASAPPWHRQGISGQTFRSSVQWKTHLSLVDDVTQVAKPVLISRDGVFLCGLPVLDLAIRENAQAPLPNRCTGRVTNAASNRVVRDLLELLITEHLSRADATPLVKVDRWPKGYQAAFTVRHDYDRQIPSASIDELVQAYKDLEIKCSIGFLSYLSPNADVAAFRKAGHEIQFHAHVRDASTFNDGLKQISQLVENDVHGVTVHGGGTSLGAIGDTFLGWAEEEGLDYAEGFFNLPNPPVTPIIRIGPSGFPIASRLFGSRGHVSLDLGMKPGTPSRLNEAKYDIDCMFAARDHVILMNHPDLNRDDLISLISGIDFRNIWHATQHQVVRWFRNTHFASSARVDGNLLKLHVPTDDGIEPTIAIYWGCEQREATLVELLASGKVEFDCGKLVLG